MNILFCGSFLPRNFETVEPFLSIAGNQYQNNLINALSVNNSVEKTSYIGFPTKTEKKLLIDSCSEDNIQVFFEPNIIKRVLNFRRTLKQKLNNADMVISYNCTYPWFGLGKMAKRLGKRSVLVLADYTPPKEEASFAGKFRQALSQLFIKQYKKVVMLSPRSKECLTKKQEQEIVFGCYDSKKFSNILCKNQQEIINITYTGVLSRVTGIDLLLEAFCKIKNKNYRLVICGQGNEMKSLIDDYAHKDSRIDFRGMVSSENYIKIIENADILVNPRNMNFLQNKYNFPSKIIEYIASGRRIVSTRFNGFEFFKDNITFCDSTSDAIKEAIIKSESDDENVIFDRNIAKANEFLWEKQIEKFL